MGNERITEDSIKDLLFSMGIDTNNYIIEAQQSTNPIIKELLKTASKEQTGYPGYPEFIIQPLNNSNFLIIVECKYALNELEKLDDNNMICTDKNSVKKYALNGAYHYAQFLNKSFNVIFIGAAGDKNSLLHKIYYLPKNAIEAVPCENGLNFLSSNSIEDFANYYLGKETSTDREIKDIIKFSQEVHEFLRDYCKVTNQQKSILISAILLALDEDINIASQLKALPLDKECDGKKLTSKAHERLDNVNMENLKMANMDVAFAFIKTHNTLNKINVQLNMTPLKALVLKVKEGLYAQFKKNLNIDILGKFYGEFISYDGGDGKGLGIVLTPPHITDLMCELAQITENDIVLDICTGTGAFLVSAMSRMFSLVNNSTIFNQKEKESKIENIKKLSLIGCEVEEHMYTIAATNMILRGDGKSNLFPESCFDIFDTLKGFKPTVGLINPPYSQGKKGGEDLREIRFIEYMLECLEPAGRGLAIVPKNVAIGKNTADIALKRRLLLKHTLEAVITMPANLFHPKATNTCIMIFTAHKPHPINKQVWFCNFEDAYILDKSLGRIASSSSKKLCNDLINNYINTKEINNYSTKVEIDGDDEWLYGAHKPTDGIQDIIELELKVKDFLSFKIKKEMEEKIYCQKN